jgi:uncharacterized protein
VVGEDAAARELEAAALARYAVNKMVVRLRREQVAELPPALGHLAELREEGSFAVVCRGNVCLPVVRDVEGLMAGLGGVGVRGIPHVFSGARSEG